MFPCGQEKRQDGRIVVSQPTMVMGAGVGQEGPFTCSWWEELGRVGFLSLPYLPFRDLAWACRTFTGTSIAFLP